MAVVHYLRLRQICLVATDMSKAEADIYAVLGSRPCYRDPNVAKYGLQNALFPIGEDLLEVVVPTRADTAAGRFLTRSGGRGGYMVIIDCSDGERRRTHVEALGIRIANVLDYPDYKAIQLHPKDGRAAIIELNRTNGGVRRSDPYHPAGHDWPEVARHKPTSRLLSVDVQSPRPQELAAHWGRILEVDVRGGEVPVMKLEDHIISFSADDGVEALVGMEIAVADPGAAVQAARDQNLIADDGTIRLHGMTLTLRDLKEFA